VRWLDEAPESPWGMAWRARHYATVWAGLAVFNFVNAPRSITTSAICVSSGVCETKYSSAYPVLSRNANDEWAVE
jgi:hypothetical protein